jgi:hypothetical protein
LKAIREKKKKQITYKDKHFKITADFSMEILKAGRTWSKFFQALNKNNLNSRIVCPAKISLKIGRAIKVFQDKQK